MGSTISGVHIYGFRSRTALRLWFKHGITPPFFLLSVEFMPFGPSHM
jgi:hypothetical protein